MNAITFDLRADNTVDARDSLSPIPVIKLKGALKTQPLDGVVALQTTSAELSPNLERDVRDYCTSTGHLHLGVDHLDGMDIHYVKKQAVVCSKCSKARVALAGLAAVAALVYTAPQVVVGDPSAPITALFLAALAALPPVMVNSVRILGELTRSNAKG